MTAEVTEREQLRTRRTSQQWQVLFDRFEHSGQTREQFCSEYKVSLSSFVRWRTKLRKQPSVASVKAEPPLFAELAMETAAMETATPDSPVWDVELQLGTGVILRLRHPC